MKNESAFKENNSPGPGPESDTLNVEDSTAPEDISNMATTFGDTDSEYQCDGLKHKKCVFNVEGCTLREFFTLEQLNEFNPGYLARLHHNYPNYEGGRQCYCVQHQSEEKDF